MAVKFSLGMLGAFKEQIRALVFAGFPTTSTLMLLEATFSMIFPYAWKIAPLSFSKSDLSMPGSLGLAPTRMAASASLNAVSASVVQMILSTRLKAESYNSSFMPSKNFWA